MLFKEFVLVELNVIDSYSDTLNHKPWPNDQIDRSSRLNRLSIMPSDNFLSPKGIAIFGTPKTTLLTM